MKVRTDYKICPFCGAALDVGEFCDCEQTTQPKKAKKKTRRKGSAAKASA